MEILIYIFSWLPMPFNVMVIGLFAFFVVVALLKLISYVWEALPFA